jgi:anaerobic magnesium-protoporphyrin IX monomethyl ester cyclase
MICLVRPPAVECFRFATTSITLPLGLAYIAGALRAAGRDVCVVDAVGEGPETMTRYYKGYLVGLPLDEVVTRIPAAADVVGISVIFTHEWPEVVRLVDLIKARRPDLTVVLGGEHVSSMPEFCLLTSKVDILVLGEGEETIVELIAALEAGRPLGEIDGLAFREQNRVVVNRRRKRKREIDSIPRPAWDLFGVRTYHEHRFVGGMYSSSLSIPILATRGCPYQCTYCSAPNMWTPQWIPRDPVALVDEIEHYVTTYGAGDFPFQDLTAIIKKDWIVAFCREILRRDLKITWQFPTGTRSEAIDTEVAQLLLQSGMVSIAYAPESGSDTTRKLIKKKMRSEKLLDSVRAAAAADLNVIAFLVVGFPHDTREHILENMPFLDQLAAEGVTDVTVGFYMALPGTELFDSLYDAGKIKLDRAYFRHMLHNLALWPAQSYSESLSRLELTVLKFRMFLRFYGAKRKSSGGRVELLASIRRAVSGFRSGAHASRLQTAFRNGVTSARDTLRTRLKPAWMPEDEELRIFEGWEATYRAIRRAKLADGRIEVSPADTSTLHLSSYVSALRRDHEHARTMVLPGRLVSGASSPGAST